MLIIFKYTHGAIHEYSRSKTGAIHEYSRIYTMNMHELFKNIHELFMVKKAGMDINQSKNG